jgi:hypothetical protein
MANTKKQVTSVENKSTKSDKSDKEVELENKILQMEAMIKQLMDLQMQSQATIQNDNIGAAETTNKPTTTSEEDDEMDDVPFRKFIKVMSLTNHTLSLSTEGMGRGKVYDFVEFGQMKHIIYEDLSNIIHNQPTFTDDLAYVILNPKVVKLHGKEEIYKKMISKDVILKLLDANKDEIITTFKNTTKSIQEAIVSVIVDKLVNGENVDLNKLDVLSNLYGRDINVMAKELIRRKNPELYED